MIRHMAQPEAGLSIGTVAEATGMSVHALRFFEREGIFLRPIPRSDGGHRVYEQADVDWLLLCNRLRQSGMPIATIRRFADLVRAGAGNEQGSSRSAAGSTNRLIRAEIAQLNACLEVIHGKVVVYQRHLRDRDRRRSVGSGAQPIGLTAQAPGALSEEADHAGDASVLRRAAAPSSRRDRARIHQHENDLRHGGRRHRRRACRSSRSSRRTRRRRRRCAPVVGTQGRTVSLHIDSEEEP